MTVVESFVFPLKTSHPTGHPSALVINPRKNGSVRLIRNYGLIRAIVFVRVAAWQEKQGLSFQERPIM